MSIRISPTLSATDSGDICCNACGHNVAPHDPTIQWKDKAALATEPVRGIAGWPDAVHPQLVLRKFACPSCGSLLDSEVALPEDPYLYDVVIG